MAPIATSRRRTRDESLFDEEQSSLTDDTTDTNKRRRLDIDTSNSIHDASSINGQTQTNGLHTEELQSQPSGRKHQPGAIVRVKLEDFVTYTAVEFFPGPSLNMVIGPNGTGKSTLVCAICIGLGWSPNYLGRAKEVSEFVKHGKQEAMIEIELAKDGQRFKSNIIVRCIIKREGNRTIYSVNGENKSRKGAVELARSLSIQVDNLCQFLPQDKVVEFAAMTPVDLLKSTQRAVASQEMIDTHEELKTRKKEQAITQFKMDEEQSILQNLESRQRLQEGDVERIREREHVVNKIEYLEAARPFAEYRAARNAHLEAREKRKKAQEVLQEHKARVEPSLAAVNEKTKYRDEVSIAVKERKNAIERSAVKADKIDKDIQTLYDQSAALDTEATAEKKGGQKHKGDVARINGNIDRLNRQMEDPPAEVDTAAYNDKIREKQRAIDGYESNVRGAQARQRELHQLATEKKRCIEQAERDLSQLDSQAGKQNMKLQKSSSDTYKAWTWIQENQGEFQKTIYGPPIVECSIKDPKYVDHIEAMFQRGMLLSFTAQTHSDFQKLSDILHKRLHLSEVNIKTIIYSLDQFQPPMSAEEMRRVGFESWALEHVQAPEPVLAMLCAELKLHETGISLRDTTPQQFQMLERTKLTSWVTSNSKYQISRRREYGAGALSTQVREVRKAQVWTDQPVDLTAKRELQENIEGWTEETSSLKSEYQDLQTKVKEERDKLNNDKEQLREIADEKSSKQKAYGEFRALPTKLEQEKSKRDEAQDFLDGVRGRLDDINERKGKAAMKRAKLALAFADAVEDLRTAHNDLHIAELMSIEVSSDLDVLTVRNKDIISMLDEYKLAVERISQEVSQLSASGKALMGTCKKQLDEGNEERRTFLRALPEGQTMEELNNDIDSEKARLELMHEGDGGVIREFEKRRHQMEKLVARLDELKSAKVELDGVVETLQNQWEPKLDELVQKISHSFSFNMEQISCAGEVGIKKDDDFDQWAIEIRVKFRETEPLTPLDSHRQSGGERAVSTIFYLMSLQSLTRSPFRVVDEINQGMDPRNERLVHKRMVGIACGTDGSGNSSGGSGPDAVTSGSQYFLITPKLLHDLEYARGMQVLCIASGEYMPPAAERARVDFGACVRVMRGLRSSQGRGGGMGGDSGVARVEVAA